MAANQNAAIRAPKQWSLSKDETITTFESWRQNLKYVLSLDPNFAPFVQDGAEWTKKTRADPVRGLVNDGADVVANLRRTAAQKVCSFILISCLDKLLISVQSFRETPLLKIPPHLTMCGNQFGHISVSKQLEPILLTSPK